MKEMYHYFLKYSVVYLFIYDTLVNEVYIIDLKGYKVYNNPLHFCFLQVENMFHFCVSVIVALCRQNKRSTI